MSKLTLACTNSDWPRIKVFHHLEILYCSSLGRRNCRLADQGMPSVLNVFQVTGLNKDGKYFM